MRVLLTGATGFIGSHAAAEFLRRGAEVTVLVRPRSDTWRLAQVRRKLNVIEGDLEHGPIPDLKGLHLDCCLHLAWYCDPADYRDSTRNSRWVDSSMELLQALSLGGCTRIVTAGTCFEYAPGTGVLPETAPLDPINLYAAAKNSLRLIAEKYCGQTGMSLAWARIFYLYGPAENRKRLTPYVIGRLLAAEPCPLTSGDQVRDFLHVTDVASGLVDISTSGVSGPINIGSGIPVTVGDVAREIGRQLGRKELLQFGAQKEASGDPGFICADTRRLKTDTAWNPRFDLPSGIADSIDWWRRHAEAQR